VQCRQLPAEGEDLRVEFPTHLEGLYLVARPGRRLHELTVIAALRESLSGWAHVRPGTQIRAASPAPGRLRRICVRLRPKLSDAQTAHAGDPEAESENAARVRSGRPPGNRWDEFTI
jgi:hypothetical protein